jgi:hypothetical protein
MIAYGPLAYKDVPPAAFQQLYACRRYVGHKSKHAVGWSSYINRHFVEHKAESKFTWEDTSAQHTLRLLQGNDLLIIRCACANCATIWSENIAVASDIKEAAEWFSQTKIPIGVPVGQVAH